MMFAGVEDFLKKYQGAPARKASTRSATISAPGATPISRILGDAVAATKSTDDNKLADYIGNTTFKTIMGDVKFGKGGEWAEGRMLQVQYHSIKSTELDQFRGMDTQTVLTPDKYKTGDVIYPFEKAKYAVDTPRPAQAGGGGTRVPRL